MTHETVITGFKYHVGMHMICCHGPVDEVQEIRVGDRSAWTGSYTEAGVGFVEIGASTTTVTAGIPDWEQYRTDRVVYDVQSNEFRVVAGSEQQSEPPEPPGRPADTISIGALVWWGGLHQYQGERQITANWSVSPDHSYRDPDVIEDEANDFQMSWDSDTELATGGDLEITSGRVSTDAFGGTLLIDKPELFGGEKHEGGIQGTIDVPLGGENQGQNDYLRARLGSEFGGDIPAFRGLVSIILRQVYVGVIPRIKPWAITAKRAPVGWSDAITGGLIGDDANPAHIIGELITNNKWGMGYSEGQLRRGDFEYAAELLLNEGFGLSMLWQNADQGADDFMREVARHIDASIYVDPITALWRITLHRHDYITEAVPDLTRDDIVEITEYSRPGYGDMISQLTVKYTDGDPGPSGEPPSWKERAVSAHNIATISTQGGRIVSQTNDYPGITKKELATRVVARDIRQLGRPLARVEMVLTARNIDLRPGSVRALSNEEYGIERLIIRVVEVEYGTLQDGQIRVVAVEDTFASEDALYAEPPDVDQPDPTSPPSPAPYRMMDEATYYDIYQDLGSATLVDELPETAGRLVTHAVRPSQDAFGYTIWEVHQHNGETEHHEEADGDFSPSAVLSAAARPEDNVLVIETDTHVDLGRVDLEYVAYLGDEIVLPTAIDASGGTITVERGVLDTVPRRHAKGTRIYLDGEQKGHPETVFSQGDELDVKLTTRTPRGNLPLEDAPVDTINMAARMIRPYPPGNIRLNGEAWPSTVDGVPMIEWSHRDRLQQTGPIITQDEGNIGPEDGVQYRIRIYDGDPATASLLRTVTGQTGTSYTYNESTELADGGPLTNIGWEVESYRDGWDSWQAQRHHVYLAGYGRQYGQFYGGLNNA